MQPHIPDVLALSPGWETRQVRISCPHHVNHDGVCYGRTCFNAPALFTPAAFAAHAQQLHAPAMCGTYAAA